jgi:hypothetical protein
LPYPTIKEVCDFNIIQVTYVNTYHSQTPIWYNSNMSEKLNIRILKSKSNTALSQPAHKDNEIRFHVTYYERMNEGEWKLTHTSGDDESVGYVGFDSIQVSPGFLLRGLFFPYLARNICLGGQTIWFRKTSDKEEIWHVIPFFLECITEYRQVHRGNQDRGANI